MRLATVRTSSGTRAVRASGDQHIDLGFSDVGALLSRPDWRELARVDGTPMPAQGADFAPLVTEPSKVVCVGHNYENHIREMGRELPTFPTLFCKLADSLAGAYDDIVKPRETDALDWEVELAVVMGKKGRDIPKDKAYDYVFGYTVCLDMTARELQRQHGQWFKGKSLDTFCPLGPWIVHKSALPDPQQVRLICRVNGEVMQDGNTRDMIFDIPTTIESLSAGMTLEPGDIISTGTPSGVGFARVPPVFLKPGDKVEGEVEGIGTLEVEIVAP